MAYQGTQPLNISQLSFDGGSWDPNTGSIQDTSNVVPGSTSNTAVPGDNTGYSAPAYTQAQVNQYDDWINNVYSTTNDAISSTGRDLGSSIDNYLFSGRTGQQGLNNQGVNNYLARMQGAQGILGMVGRGIKSGGVMLANRNAGDSSATGALSRAYGDMGRRQMAGIGNQFAVKESQRGQAQANFQEQMGLQANQIRNSKQKAIDGIVTSATTELARLDAEMANASLPDKINLEAEKTRIKNDAIAQLAQYDSQLDQGIAGITPMSEQDMRAEAARLNTAGTDLGADAFNFTDQVPAQWQGTGPFASELPLFLAPKKRS